MGRHSYFAAPVEIPTPAIEAAASALRDTCSNGNEFAIFDFELEATAALSAAWPHLQEALEPGGRPEWLSQPPKPWAPWWRKWW